MIDAHNKADTLHRDVNLENIILYMDVDGTSRVGYLINWNLSCKTDDTPIDASKLPVCSIHPLTLTITSDASPGDSRFQVL